MRSIAMIIVGVMATLYITIDVLNMLTVDALQLFHVHCLPAPGHEQQPLEDSELVGRQSAIDET